MSEHVKKLHIVDNYSGDTIDLPIITADFDDNGYDYVDFGLQNKVIWALDENRRSTTVGGPRDGSWELATVEEFEDLWNNSTVSIVQRNGYSVYKFTNKKDTSKAIYLGNAGNFTHFRAINRPSSGNFIIIISSVNGIIEYKYTGESSSNPAPANTTELYIIHPIIKSDTIVFERGKGEYSVQQISTNAIANGRYSFAINNSTRASGVSSHSEGYKTVAAGYNSHAEGKETRTLGMNSHAEGYLTFASGLNSHAEGNETEAKGGSHAEGYKTRATGDHSHAEGHKTIASGDDTHAEGYETSAEHSAAHAEGYKTTARGSHSHAEGYGGTALGSNSHVEGGYILVESNEFLVKSFNSSQGIASHAEGAGSVAKGDFSHAEGYGGEALGESSHVEGKKTLAEGNASHAEGISAKAIGNNSHAEGAGSIAEGDVSHAEGYQTYSRGNYSHAEGRTTNTHGECSHSEGCMTIAGGRYSHAEGYNTTASNEAEHASGKYNISTSGKTLFSIGDGTSSLRHNALHISNTGELEITNTIEDFNTEDNVDMIYVQERLQKVIRITWRTLIEIRNLKKLIPGVWYRITDYSDLETTDTLVPLAGSVSASFVNDTDGFDILVLATSTNTLSEEARVILHSLSNNNNFKNCNVESWKIWYCIDSDTTRFDWASSSCKGIIYRMIDNNNNDIPYDFKHIVFNRYRCTIDTTNYPLISSLNNTYCGFLGITLPGVSISTSSSVYRYTFDSHSNTSSITSGDDYSITKSNHNNVIKPYIVSNKQRLNNIVFLGSSIYYNHFNNDCYNMTINSSCFRNIFNDGCYGYIFGSGCTGNTFGTNCYNNIFVNNAQYNSFGNNCFYNALGISCFYNIFGNRCYNNKLNSSTSYNSFGNNCNNNTLGDINSYNSFGNNCYDNMLGESCLENSFGNECHNIVFEKNCSNNSFENSCYNITFGRGGTSNSFGNQCYNINFLATSSDASGLYSNSHRQSFGNYCSFINLNSDCVNNKFGNYAHHIRLGTHNEANSFGNDCGNIVFGTLTDYENKNYSTSSSSRTGNQIFVTDKTNKIYEFVKYIEIQDGVNFVTLLSSSGSSAWNNNICNITVHKGVNGGKRIDHSNIEISGDYPIYQIPITPINYSTTPYTYETNVSRDKTGIITIWTT